MKNTPIEYPILDVIKNRWSPRAFANESITDDELNSLFEAARWAPSSMNEQPWSFIYARKGEKAFETISDGLFEGNSWAKEAPVLIVALTRTTFTRNEKPNVSALYDLGQAVANLSIQATYLGLSLHQMGGIDRSHLESAFGLTESYEIATVIALGKRGNPDQLPDSLKERELSTRKRNQVNDFTFHGHFKNYISEN